MRVRGDEIDFKLRQLWVPVIALTVALLAAYSFVDWLLVARNVTSPVHEEVIDWLPLGIAWLLVLTLVQPKLALLKRDKKGNLTALYHFAAVAIVAAPTVLAQGYIRTSTGGTTHLHELADASSTPATRYYIADQVCISYAATRSVTVASMPTGWEDRGVITTYAVEPICGGAASSSSSVWIGLKFQTSFARTSSQQEREETYRSFREETAARLGAEDPRAYQFFAWAGRNKDTSGFGAALRNSSAPVALENAILLTPHTEPFSQRSGDRLPWVLRALVIGSISWFALLLARPMDHAKWRKWKEEGAAVHRPTYLALFIPRPGSYGLPILIDMNVLVFLAMALSGYGFFSFDTDTLLKWGGNYRPALHGLGLLRLLSSQFVHVGIMHLANNLYGLLIAGIFLTPIVSNARLIISYLLAGTGAGVASAMLHPATVSVGASGGIFGLFGMLLTLMLLRDDRVPADVRKVIVINAAIFVALNLVLGVLSPGIDNAAHIGGLVTGILLGLLMFAARARRGSAAPTTSRTPNI